MLRVLDKPFCGMHVSVPQCFFPSSESFPPGGVGSVATGKGGYKVLNGWTDNALGRG